MTEPQISPLARRLAEENSIDWRVIPGTGPENRVIERDILTYLARIMSGEIDPPALPDASEPPSPGGAAPDLSEVSNLAAASAGMAKEGIDLSSLLSGAAPVAAGLTAPMFGTPEPVIAPATIPEPVATPALNFQIPDAPIASSVDFAFSDAPSAAPQNSSLEQISFGDPTPVEAPISFGDPVASDFIVAEPVIAAPAPSAPPAKPSPADSVDAEFEIDLDDFDDAPAALEISPPATSASSSSAAERSVADFAVPHKDEADFPAFELASPDLAFTAPASEATAHQEDLILEIDSAAEAPLAQTMPEVSSPMDDDLVMTDFAAPNIESSSAAFDLEPAAAQTPFESPELEPAHVEPAYVELEHIEPAHTEPVQLEPSHLAVQSVADEDDDFELDLSDVPSLPVQSTTSEAPMPVQAIDVSPALEPDFSAGAVAVAVAAGGLLTAATLQEPALDSPAVTPPQPMSEVQLATPSEIPAAQPSAASPSSAVASGYFQGFAVRRHFDASALTKIQHELTQALNGRDVPLAVFLARAAQRNLHLLGIGDIVTLTRLGETVEPLQASGLHHSFIEAVQSVARATAGTMQGLLVLDASSLGVDDLVLPVMGPVLTLNVNGEYGHLALAGDVPMNKAADFLGKIAQALEIPVSLVI